MTHGVLKVKRKKGQASTRTFGATTPTYTPFSLDAFPDEFPDQNADGFPEDCTIYTQNELAQDEDKVKYNRAFLKKKVLDKTGHEGPYDINESLESLVVYGVLGEKETTDAQAYAHRRGRPFRLEKNPGMDWFDSAISIMQTTGRSLSVAGPWFPSFERINSNGRLPDDFPMSWQDGVPGHNHKVYGYQELGYIIGKSWQGTRYGDGGKHYWSRAAFNRYMGMLNTGAFMVSKYTGSQVDIQYGMLYNIKFQIALLIRKLFGT